MAKRKSDGTDGQIPVAVRLDRGVDWDELTRIVQDAYAEVASPARARGPAS